MANSKRAYGSRKRRFEELRKENPERSVEEFAKLTHLSVSRIRQLQAEYKSPQKAADKQKSTALTVLAEYAPAKEARKMPRPCTIRARHIIYLEEGEFQEIAIMHLHTGRLQAHLYVSLKGVICSKPNQKKLPMMAGTWENMHWWQSRPLSVTACE